MSGISIPAQPPTKTSREPSQAKTEMSRRLSSGGAFLKGALKNLSTSVKSVGSGVLQAAAQLPNASRADHSISVTSASNSATSLATGQGSSASILSSTSAPSFATHSGRGSVDDASQVRQTGSNTSPSGSVLSLSPEKTGLHGVPSVQNSVGQISTSTRTPVYSSNVPANTNSTTALIKPYSDSTLTASASPSTQSLPPSSDIAASAATSVSASSVPSGPRLDYLITHLTNATVNSWKIAHPQRLSDPTEVQLQALRDWLSLLLESSDVVVRGVSVHSTMIRLVKLALLWRVPLPTGEVGPQMIEALLIKCAHFLTPASLSDLHVFQEWLSSGLPMANTFKESRTVHVEKLLSRSEVTVACDVLSVSGIPFLKTTFPRVMKLLHGTALANVDSVAGTTNNDSGT